ncbi:hypothetical protein AB0K47_04285 [Streptomyces tirandamycinicus]|uniref:hypothetical protein n=1 Tax=Streptomyces tirandamycinicus TaxID=2174846 RepID=UPI0003786517
MPAVPPTRLKRLVLASVCAASALALTACGPLGQAAEKSTPSAPSSPSGPYPGLSGSEILNKAITATKAATSLRLRVTTETADGPVRGDLAVDTKGDCAGTLQMGAEGGVELVKTGDTVYMRFDEKMLRSQADGEEETQAALDLLLGKWVREKADAADAKDFAEFCDLDSYLEGFQANDTVAKRAGESTVGGTPTVVLTESHQGEKATAQVAAKGTPHLLRLQVTGGAEPIDMTFSEFDEPVPVKKPAAKDIVDLD